MHSRRRWLAFGLLALAGTFQCQAQPGPVKKRALVIGNNAYSKPLANAVEDAQSIGQTLRAAGYDVVLTLDANLGAMKSVVNEFVADTMPGDITFFFFAGHGFQAQGENYLLPTDFAAGSFETAQRRAMAVSTVVDGLTAHKAKLRVIVLDACRNNPFDTRRGALPGLASMDVSSSGTYYAFATAPGGTAEDSGGSGHGLFTKVLLQNLTIPNLTLDRLFSQVRNQVYKESGGAQTPWISSGIVDTLPVTRELPQQNIVEARSALPPSIAALVDSLVGSRTGVDVTRPDLAALLKGVIEQSKPPAAILSTPPADTTVTKVPSLSTGGSSSGTSLQSTRAANASSLSAETMTLSPRGLPTFDAAVEAFKADDIPGSRALLLDLRNSGPDDAEVAMMLGQVDLLLGEFQEALANINIAITIGPLDPRPVYLRCIARSLQGQYAGALKDCRSGLAMRPNDPRFLTATANTLFVIGQIQEAIDLSTRAQAMDPNYALAFVVRGNARRVIADTKGAVADFAQASKLQSSDH
jgi:tetratricopeptide (TPR) repeat protein